MPGQVSTPAEILGTVLGKVDSVDGLSAVIRQLDEEGAGQLGRFFAQQSEAELLMFVRGLNPAAPAELNRIAAVLNARQMPAARGSTHPARARPKPGAGEAAPTLHQPPITLACGSCRAKLRVKPELSGKRVKCSQCGRPVRVPTQEVIATCPKCGKAGKVPDQARGKLAKCRACGTAFPVRPPTGTGEPPADCAGSDAWAALHTDDSPVPTRHPTEDWLERHKVALRRLCYIGAGVAGVLVIGAALLWLARRGPGFYGPRDLSGAKGPRLEMLGKPNQSMPIKNIFLCTSRLPTTKSREVQYFASGTPELHCVVAFEGAPPQGTRFDFTVFNASGPLNMYPRGQLTEELSSYGQVVACLIDTPLCPEAGAYPDGDYQAEVRINGERFALLNFSVGKAAGDAPAPRP
jgi:hypothetical protein